jgi:hypothetical protein
VIWWSNQETQSFSCAIASSNGPKGATLVKAVGEGALREGSNSIFWCLDNTKINKMRTDTEANCKAGEIYFCSFSRFPWTNSQPLGAFMLLSSCKSNPHPFSTAPSYLTLNSLFLIHCCPRAQYGLSWWVLWKKAIWLKKFTHLSIFTMVFSF